MSHSYCAIIFLADPPREVQKVMLVRIQDCHGISGPQLLPWRKHGAAAIGVEGDRQRRTCFIADGEFDSNQLFDIRDFGQETPVLSRHEAEPVRSVVEGKVYVAISWKAGKGRESLAVAEVCVLLALREFLGHLEALSSFLLVEAAVDVHFQEVIVL